MRLIDADRLSEAIHENVSALYEDAVFAKEDCLTEVYAALTIDAVPVVRCEKCVLHGNCVTEDAFVLAGIENPFCCVGKRKEGADNGS